MPLTLDAPIAINDTISTVKINSFAVDMDRKEIYVGYSEMNGTTVLAEKTITIVEPDFTKSITDANSFAGVDVYGPLKTSLYNQIKTQAMLSGSVA